MKAVPGTVLAGSDGWFTWAPTNTGAFDMAMARIRPGSEPGGWVELALDPLPKLFGGDDRPRRGGDATGLIRREGGFLMPGTRPVMSMIRPGRGDERDVRVHVPAGTPASQYMIRLVVEGNFEPVPVEIPITVR